MNLDHVPTLKYECTHDVSPDQTEVTVHVNGEPRTVMFSVLREGDVLVVPGHDELYKVVVVRMDFRPAYVLCDPYDALQ